VVMVKGLKVNINVRLAGLGVSTLFPAWQNV
jgi:hypothetical protein